MPIQITCAQCAREYRLDSKLAGKTVRCKKCGGAMHVPSQDPLDFPDLPPLDVAESAPEYPPCPSCGVPLPPSNAICLSCGYNPSSRQKARTVVERGSSASVPRNFSSPNSERNSRGIREWQPYGNPLLHLLDASTTNLAVFLFAGLMLLGIGWPLVMAIRLHAPSGLVFFFVLQTAVNLGVFFGITLPITIFGLSKAAEAFKFGLPDNSKSRVVAMSTVAFAAAGIVFALTYFLVVTNSYHNAHAANHSLDLADLLRQNIATPAIVAILTFVAVNFAAFLLLFHLTIFEGIFSYLTLLLFYVVGSLIAAAILWPIQYGLTTLAKSMLGL